MIFLNSCCKLCIIFSVFLLNVNLVFLKLVKNDDSTLHAVVVLFRHGDRNPESHWPNDNYFYNMSLWKDGYGELTNKGKLRHYELGKWLRKRYASFLSARFNASDIYVRSTDVDRTIMSAQANLAGLYYPEDDQIWNPKVLWQPVPVHVVPSDSDCILSAEMPCPAHQYLQDKVFSDFPELQKLVDEHKDVMYNLSICSGYDPKNFSIYEVSGLYSTIRIYNGMNLTLPQWTKDYYLQMSYLTGVKFRLPTYSSTLARLRTGPFFDYLLNHFDGVQARNLGKSLKGMEPKKNTKFLMLSAHDTTIADVTNTLGAYDNSPIEFGTSIIWELKSKDDDFFLNFYLKNSTVFKEIRVKGCDFDCKLSDFKSILKPIALDKFNWQKECLAQEKEYRAM